jgi:hypothetical protein
LTPRGIANQGRRAPLRFALAPGYHIPRRWRLALRRPREIPVGVR